MDKIKGFHKTIILAGNLIISANTDKIIVL